jgi:hypothetical protein
VAEVDSKMAVVPVRMVAQEEGLETKAVLVVELRVKDIMVGLVVLAQIEAAAVVVLVALEAAVVALRQAHLLLERLLLVLAVAVVGQTVALKAVAVAVLVAVVVMHKLEATLLEILDQAEAVLVDLISTTVDLVVLV